MNPAPGPAAAAPLVRTSAQHLQMFRQVLLSVNQDVRDGLRDFWGAVRISLNTLDEENHQLRQQIQRQQQQIQQLQQQQAAAAPPPAPPPAAPQPALAGGAGLPLLAPPPRPHTSDSLDAVRVAVNTAILNVAREADEGSTVIEEICDLDPAWARNFLMRQKHVLLCQQSELGCWVSGNAPSEKQYVKVNMRNTRRPGSNNTFTTQPFGHQLAVVAAGNGQMLRLTSGNVNSREFDCSHLCHNPACFCPEHLIVEESALNKRRNTCHRSFIIVHPDGTIINPCTHWIEGRRLHCILPSRQISTNAVGRALDTNERGPVFATGRSTQR